jgi:hypothetical protein
VIAAAAVLGGCAPHEFDRAIGYYSEREHVRDAAARRTRAAWFLRFDTELIHELDLAIAEPDEDAARALAEKTLRRANILAIKSTTAEIERLSDTARQELAALAKSSVEVDSLASEVRGRAEADLEAELAVGHLMSGQQWRARIKEIRAGVEPLPDDRDRAARRVLLLGLSPLVAAGIEQKEREIQASVRTRRAPRVERGAIWTPAFSREDDATKWAPLIAVDWPRGRDYPEDLDRIGAISLSGTREKITVSVVPKQPTVYTYVSTANIHGKSYGQLNYVWWFSDRPAISPDDAAAGHIDGGTLRLTLDRTNRPAIAEIILNCGCGHELYVAEDIENAAAREFGPPLEGAEYSIELRSNGKRPILVAGTFDRSSDPSRPLVVLQAGTHEPLGLVFSVNPTSVTDDIAETHEFELRGYDTLDRLPLGDGVASMFGSDGLVHFAGRREGFLLAPSGILSAGQPRKRGTQRIRWDEYLFDDPTLLASTLRLPATY